MFVGGILMNGIPIRKRSPRMGMGSLKVRGEDWGVRDEWWMIESTAVEGVRPN